MSHWEPILCYSNCFPRCISQDISPTPNAKFMMWYPQTVRELTREAVVQFLCFLVYIRHWVLGQLFREEVPVSAKVRTHSQSQTGRQVRRGTSITAHECEQVCMCRQKLIWLLRHWNTKETTLEAHPGSASGQVNKLVCYNRTKLTTACLRGLRRPKAFAAGAQNLLSGSTEAKGQGKGLLPLKRSQPKLL